MIDRIKARAALLAVVNAVVLVLALFGKIAESQSTVIQQNVGALFDAVIAITAPLATVLPGIFGKRQ